jgi:hypothetical protein
MSAIKKLCENPRPSAVCYNIKLLHVVSQAQSLVYRPVITHNQTTQLITFPIKNAPKLCRNLHKEFQNSTAEGGATPRLPPPGTLGNFRGASGRRKKYSAKTR